VPESEVEKGSAWEIDKPHINNGHWYMLESIIPFFLLYFSYFYTEFL